MSPTLNKIQNTTNTPTTVHMDILRVPAPCTVYATTPAPKDMMDQTKNVAGRLRSIACPVRPSGLFRAL